MRKALPVHKRTRRFSPARAPGRLDPQLMALLAGGDFVAVSPGSPSRPHHGASQTERGRRLTYSKPCFFISFWIICRDTSAMLVALFISVPVRARSASR